MSGEWEDIAVGPSASSSGGEWEDVAAGPAVQAAPQSFIGNVWQGVKNAPGAALDTVASIPSGISNIFNSVVNPIDSLNSGVTEKTVRGIGSLAAGTAGAGAGALAGAPLAPLTFGASVPVGAAIGGAASLLGYDWLNEFTGSDAPTTPEQDVAKLGQNIGTGLALSAASSALNKGYKAVGGPSIKEIANAIDRKSLSTRQSDYGKPNSQNVFESADGFETNVKATLDDLLESNKLGTSRNPSSVLTKIDEKVTPLRNELNSIIKAYDDGNNAPALPSFDESVNYLSKGKVSANEIDSYLTEIANLNSNILREGGGKLDFLQKQKQAYGELWKSDKTAKAGFYRAIYDDLKTSIEKYVPEVEGINKELAKYQDVQKIANRALRADENVSPLTKLRDAVYTTGGIGAPTIVGSIVGGPVGAALGAGVGLAGKAIASPTGQSLVAKALRGTSAIADIASKNNLPVSAVESVANDLFKQEASKRSAVEDLFSKESTMKKALEAPEALSAARVSEGKKMTTPPEVKKVFSSLIKQESAGNKNAVSTENEYMKAKGTGTAKGVGQLLDATGKEMFTKYKKELGKDASPEKYDPFNEEQNKFLSEKYLTELYNKYDDIELALTAYHSGMGTVDKLLKANKADSLAGIIEDLGPVGQKYAKQVLGRIKV